MKLVDKILSEARILSELFDGKAVYPYRMLNGSTAAAVYFDDDQGNSISITFTGQKIEGGEMSYDINFSVNGAMKTDKDGQKMTGQQYVKMINTVTAAVQDFVAKTHPYKLTFSAINEPGKDYSQRFKIYSAIVNKLGGDYEKQVENGSVFQKMILVRKGQ